jgi:nucleotide-binding universal stress UspA family protein
MRVLIATDGSECAGVAVDLVAALDWPAKTVLHAVEVVPSGVAVFGGPWPPMTPVDTSSIDVDIREQAGRNLQDAAERLAGPARTVETSALSGRAGDAIVSLAEQVEADIIVVGSRGHGTIETMLLGSVSSEVVDHAHVPVLVARGRTMERVVFAWDGSEQAEAALPALTEWGLFEQAHVAVLSVADADPPWWVSAGLVSDETAAEAYHAAAEPSRQQHEEMAGHMAKQLRAAGLKADAVSREGDPAETIVAFAEEHAADFIVLGTHGRTGLRRLLMGGVARNVLLHARCSVLLAR